MHPLLIDSVRVNLWGLHGLRPLLDRLQLHRLLLLAPHGHPHLVLERGAPCEAHNVLHAGPLRPLLLRTYHGLEVGLGHEPGACLRLSPNLLAEDAWLLLLTEHLP